MSLRWPLLTIFATGALVAGNEVHPGTPDAPDASQFAEMLGTVPADVLSADGSMFSYTNVELVWVRVGIGDDHDERAAFESLRSLPMLAWPELMTQGGPTASDDLRTEIGFDGFDIQRVLTAGAPPNDLVIIDAAVSGQAIGDAIHADPAWSPDLQEVATDAGAYFQWTDDPGSYDVSRRSAFRPIGEAGTLAIIEDDPARLVRAHDAADIEAALRTSQGEDPSVADDEYISHVLDMLDGRAVTQAIISPRPTLLDVVATLAVPGTVPTDMDELEAQILAMQDDALPIGGYLGVVIVESLDGDTVHTDVLVIHATAADATANVERINEHITGAVLLNGEPAANVFVDAEVAADGAIVRVGLPGEESFGAIYALLYQRALLPM